MPEEYDEGTNRLPKYPNPVRVRKQVSAAASAKAKKVTQQYIV